MIGWRSGAGIASSLLAKKCASMTFARGACDRLGGLEDERDEEVVLEVLADAGQVMARRDPDLFEVSGVPDPAQLQ